MPRFLEQTIGLVLIAVVLSDVFLTVLYARMGTAVNDGNGARRAALRLVEDDGRRAGSADAYVELRARWFGYIAALAPRMAYTMDEICGIEVSRRL